MKKRYSLREKHFKKENHFMKKYSRENLRAIQAIVQEKTGASIVSGQKTAGYKIRRMALLAGSLLCLVLLSAFAYAKFSDLNGEPLEGVNKIAKTIENKGFSRKGKADGKNFVRWKPLHILERCKEKRQGKTAVRHGLGIVFKL